MAGLTGNALGYYQAESAALGTIFGEAWSDIDERIDSFYANVGTYDSGQREKRKSEAQTKLTTSRSAADQQALARAYAMMQQQQQYQEQYDMWRKQFDYANRYNEQLRNQQYGMLNDLGQWGAANSGESMMDTHDARVNAFEQQNAPHGYSPSGLPWGSAQSAYDYANRYGQGQGYRTNDPPSPTPSQLAAAESSMYPQNMFTGGNFTGSTNYNWGQ